MPEEIVAIYRGDVIIPLRKLNIPPGSRIRILI
ncbi:antitoxin family protein, partial [Thermococcus sp.]